jgi:hypothetical protein
MEALIWERIFVANYHRRFPLIPPRELIRTAAQAHGETPDVDPVEAAASFEIERADNVHQVSFHRPRMSA